MTVVLRRALLNTRKEDNMKRILKQMKFKSSFSMYRFISISHLNDKDIKEVEIHGNDITLYYYVNEKEA